MNAKVFVSGGGVDSIYNLDQIAHVVDSLFGNKTSKQPGTDILQNLQDIVDTVDKVTSKSQSPPPQKPTSTSSAVPPSSETIESEQVSKFIESLFGGAAVPLKSSFVSTGADTASKSGNYDLAETNDSYEITIDAPGASKELISCNIGDDKQLEVRIDAESAEKEHKYIVRNRKTGPMVISIKMPNDANLTNIVAKYDNGLLKISIKKTVSSKIKIDIL